MRLQIIPSLLAQQRVEYDDPHHQLIVNQHLVPLSVTQYRLVTALLQQRQRWEEDPHHQEPLILTVQHLQQIAHLKRRAAVKKHLFYASSRLLGQGLLIACIHSYGYALFHVAELLSTTGPVSSPS